MTMENHRVYLYIIEEIAKQNSLTIEYYKGEWLDLYKMLEQGQIDLLPDMAFTKYRDSLFCFNKLFVINSWLEVYVHINSDIEKIKDLNNKKIGVLMSSHQQEYLTNQFSKDFDIKYELVLFESYKQTTHALIRGDVDAIVASRFYSFSDEYSSQISSTV